MPGAGYACSVPVPTGNQVQVSTASALQAAMTAAKPGDVIVLAAGTYSSMSFAGGAAGTASAPIVLMSADPTNPATLQGSGSGYTVHVTTDYWQIRNVKVTGGQKGIMFDHANHGLVCGVEVYGIADEGIHMRDASSNNVIEGANVHDTGQGAAGYGEAVYFGSDPSAKFNLASDNNTLRYSYLGPNIGSKEANLQPGATGNVVEYCTFDGTGMKGANAGYSFVSIKGPMSVVRNCTFYRHGNSVITDAIAVSYSAATVSDSTFYLDDATSADVIRAFLGGSATATNITRVPMGTMYNGPVM
jgi:hypothetical protein